MIHSVKKVTPLNACIANFFLAYKDDIISLTNKQWNDEDLKGTSIKQWNIMKYYDLLYLLIVVYNEINRTLELNYPFSYYSNKFDLEKYKKCLACSNIDIDKGYEAFRFNILSQIDGIELQEIEVSNIVGNKDYNTNNITISDLLLKGNYCLNYIN